MRAISTLLILVISLSASGQCYTSNSTYSGSIEATITQSFRAQCTGFLNSVSLIPATNHNGFQVSVYSSCSGGLLGTSCVPAGSADQAVQAYFSNVSLTNNTWYYIVVNRTDIRLRYSSNTYNPDGRLCYGVFNCFCGSGNPVDNLWFEVKIGGTSGCIAPTLPSLTATATTISCGGSTALSVLSGQLNSATTWKWYSGSCGGTLVGQGPTLTVAPTTTTTYYCRGEGCCVSGGTCSAITVTVAGVVWTGAASTDWNNPSNWCGGTVPNSSQDVTIGSGKTVVISSGTTSVNNLTLANGSNFNMTGGILKVYGSIQNNTGAIKVMTGGTIDYAKAGAQVINPSFNYWILKTSGSGTKTAPSNVTVRGQ